MAAKAAAPTTTGLLNNLTIPMNSNYQRDIAKDVKVIMTSVVESKDAAQKEYIRQNRSEKLQQDSAKEEEKIRKILEDVNPKKNTKTKNKLLETYEKWVIKNKWFQKSTKFFETVGEGAGHWLMDILKFVLMLAIFDPEGKFLMSILGFIGKMAMKLIEILVKWLPIIVQRMVHIIDVVIPTILKKIIMGVFPLIAQMFKNAAKNFPKDSVLGKLFTWLGEAFGSKGILTRFFTFLADHFKYILIILAAFKVLSIIIGFIVPLISVIGTIVGVLTTIVSIPLLIAVAVLAAIAAIYIFRKEIAQFFKWLWGVITTFAVKIFGIVIDFFKWVGEGIYKFFEPVIKLFKFVGSLIYDELIAPIIDLFTNFSFKKLLITLLQIFTFIPRMILRFVVMPIINLFKRLASAFYDNVIAPIINWIKNSWIGKAASAVGNAASGAWGAVKGAVGGAVDFIGNFFKSNPIGQAIAKFFTMVMDKLFKVMTDIGTFFWGFGKYGLSWLSMDKKESANIYKSREIQAKYNKTTEDIIQMAKEGKSFDNDAEANEFLKEIASSLQHMKEKGILTPDMKKGETSSQAIIREAQPWDIPGTNDTQIKLVKKG
jgi:hypothetical protein